MKKFRNVGFLLCFLLVSSSIVEAQTVYKKNSGFFTPVLKSFHLEENPFGSTYLIGPAFGYRLDRNWDVLFHTEFLFSEFKPNNSNAFVLNFGITGGYTVPISRRLNLRSELAIYKVFEFEGDISRNTRFLNTGLASSSFYWRVPLFKSVSFIPNIGGVVGYGVDTLPPNTVSSSLLTNDFEGFVYGPRLGLDTEFKFSENFYFIVSPTARMFYNKDLLTEFGLNFKFNF